MCQAQIQKLEGLSSTLVLCWGLGLGQVFFHWFQEVCHGQRCSIPIYFLTFAYFGQLVAPDLFVAVLKQVQEVFVSKYSVFEVSFAPVQC
jgi:hypothetical protein